MNTITDLLTYYKTGKISKFSFESELNRAFSAFSNISVKLDDSVAQGQTNSSYIAMVIPELCGGIIKNTLVLDNLQLMSALTDDDLMFLIQSVENYLPAAARKLMEFYRINNDAEVGHTECILLFLNIYENFLNILSRKDTFAEMISKKTVDMSKINDIKLAIDNRTEKSSAIIEYINVNKIMPECATCAAEKLYKELNKIDIPEYDAARPEENIWYNKLKANITGTFDPQKHEDLDPYYEPKK